MWTSPLFSHRPSIQWNYRTIVADPSIVAVQSIESFCFSGKKKFPFPRRVRDQKSALFFSSPDQKKTRGRVSSTTPYPNVIQALSEKKVIRKCAHYLPFPASPLLRLKVRKEESESKTGVRYLPYPSFNPSMKENKVEVKPTDRFFYLAANYA